MEIENEEDIYNVSIKALGLRTKKYISTLLNPIKIIPTEKGLPRDWQGLAELIGVGGEQIPQLQNDSDPTHQILNIWIKTDCKGSTIKKFIEFLKVLDRYDIIDDTKQFIEEDINNFKSKSLNGFEEKKEIATYDEDIITVDDLDRCSQGLGPQVYDSFVLYAEEDINFATELIDTMEKQYYLKLCVKERDIIIGGFKLEVFIKLITERCNRLIVIVSPAFLSSRWNKFFLTFAQGIGIEQKQRKIIPCVYCECKIPPELSCYFMLNYQRSGKLWDFWSKLHDSIRTPVHTPIAKQTLNRSLSHQLSSTQDNQLKPVLHYERNNSVRTKKECVKFKSNEEISQTTTKNLNSESELTEGSSSNSLPISENTKKSKNKAGWLKKILPQRTSRSHSDVSDKDKKKFWNRHVKRKIAVAN